MRLPISQFCGTSARRFGVVRRAATSSADSTLLVLPSLMMLLPSLVGACGGRWSRRQSRTLPQTKRTNENVRRLADTVEKLAGMGKRSGAESAKLGWQLQGAKAVDLGGGSSSAGACVAARSHVGFGCAADLEFDRSPAGSEGSP